MFSHALVNAPKYTTVEKVFALKLGLTQEEVMLALETPAYNFKLMNTAKPSYFINTGLETRTTLPFILRQNNGKKILSKYVNLVITYDKKGLSKKMEGCGDCDEAIIETKKLNIDKVVTLLTVTLSIFLVYLGIKLLPK